MPIFRVKSVKIYTGQKYLHGYIRGIRDKYEVCMHVHQNMIFDSIWRERQFTCWMSFRVEDGDVLRKWFQIKLSWALITQKFCLHSLAPSPASPPPFSRMIMISPWWSASPLRPEKIDLVRGLGMAELTCRETRQVPSPSGKSALNHGASPYTPGQHRKKCPNHAGQPLHPPPPPYGQCKYGNNNDIDPKRNAGIKFYEHATSLKIAHRMKSANFHGGHLEYR